MRKVIMEALVIEEAVVGLEILLQQLLSERRRMRRRAREVDKALAQRRGRASLDRDSRHGASQAVHSEVAHRPGRL